MVVVLCKVLNKPWQAKVMVAMPVCKENFGDFGRGKPCNAQLPLRAFAAVNKKVFIGVTKQNAAVVAGCRWHHASSAEKEDFHGFVQGNVFK